MPRQEWKTIWAALSAASDARDDIVIAACKRIIKSDRRGEPTDPADLRLVHEFYSD